jgi:hypothetical protein
MRAAARQLERNYDHGGLAARMNRWHKFASRFLRAFSTQDTNKPRGASQLSDSLPAANRLPLRAGQPFPWIWIIEPRCYWLVPSRPIQSRNKTHTSLRSVKLPAHRAALEPQRAVQRGWVGGYCRSFFGDQANSNYPRWPVQGLGARNILRSKPVARSHLPVARCQLPAAAAA